MIKRTLFFSNAVCLTMKNKQLLIFNKETREETSVPIEDIGFIIIENNQVYISIPVINELTSNNAAVVFCNDKHLPFSMSLPLDCNSIQNQLFSVQIASSLPVKKKCWKLVIEQKIKNQAKVLEKYHINPIKLNEYAKEVKSGDTTNREAIAAKLYWDLLIDVDWVRTRFGDYPNNFLNYGYAVLRAATARALIGSGLLPTLGIHHHNKYNAYALADDMMEPYRPFVDDEVLDFVRENPEHKEITAAFKKKILCMLTRDVAIGTVMRPLMIALTMTSASLAKMLSGESQTLALPGFV
ncbi:MAG: type II CRISPR-associated endonuclease Cas1 [Treponema sp.]|nr:type II CRISPR-associated endonuclease Cas1 [Treponema sp.]